MRNDAMSGREPPRGERGDEGETDTLLAVDADGSGVQQRSTDASGDAPPSISPPPPPPAAAAPGEASFALKAGAFASLVAIQVVLAMSFKAAQDANGKYAFTPAALLVVSEGVKFAMSAGAFVVAAMAAAPAGATLGARGAHAWATFRREAFASVGGTLPLTTAALAALYCVNNNATFMIFSWADGANINLIKSGSTFVSALMMWAALARPVTRVQWSAIAVQSCGLVVTQFGANCTGAPLLGGGVYLALFASLTITSLCSVWNDATLKATAKEGVSLNAVNSLLYAFGVALNLLVAMLAGAMSPSASRASFFSGLGTPAALLVVLCNSLIGIAVTAVYKYADAVVKTFASACGTAVLFIIGAAVYGVPVNVVVTAGCLSIFAATHLYVTNAAPPTAAVKRRPDGKDEDGGAVGDAAPLSPIGACFASVRAVAGPYLPTATRDWLLAASGLLLVGMLIAAHVLSQAAPSRADPPAGAPRALLAAGEALAQCEGGKAWESASESCAARFTAGWW